MKLKAPDAVAARARSPINWFLGICLAAFLTISSTSAAVQQTGVEGMNSTEKWVIAKVKAGEIADLSKQFPDEEKQKRKLGARFLEELLTGALPGFKPHRNGVRITGATRPDLMHCGALLGKSAILPTSFANSASDECFEALVNLIPE